MNNAIKSRMSHCKFNRIMHKLYQNTTKMSKNLLAYVNWSPYTQIDLPTHKPLHTKQKQQNVCQSFSNYGNISFLLAWWTSEKFMASKLTLEPYLQKINPE